MRKADIFCRGARAGVLTKAASGEYRFQYDPTYARDPTLPAISLSLPKRDAPYESTVLFPFFYGLLAEGDDKALQCRLMRIDEHDHFSRLLATCTTEAIGGVTVREIVTP